MNATTRDTASRVRELAYSKKIKAGIAEAARVGARIPEHSSGGAIKKGQSFKARAWHAGEVAELRAWKLAGGEFSQGEFSMLMDYSERFKDPMRGFPQTIARLIQSEDRPQ